MLRHWLLRAARVLGVPGKQSALELEQVRRLHGQEMYASVPALLQTHQCDWQFRRSGE